MKKFIVLLMIWMGAAGAETVMVREFSAGDLSGWEQESFSGETEYALVEEVGRRVLKAQSRGAASGPYREIRMDLNRTPYLNWTWRVANVLEGINERTKVGDDYPASYSSGGPAPSTMSGPATSRQAASGPMPTPTPTPATPG